MDINILGQMDFGYRKTYNPQRKCVICPLLCDSWCNYLKVRIHDIEYYEDCPVTKIIVEE